MYLDEIAVNRYLSITHQASVRHRKDVKFIFRHTASTFFSICMLNNLSVSVDKHGSINLYHKMQKLMPEGGGGGEETYSIICAIDIKTVWIWNFWQLC